MKQNDILKIVGYLVVSFLAFTYLGRYMQTDIWAETGLIVGFIIMFIEYMRIRLNSIEKKIDDLTEHSRVN